MKRWLALLPLVVLVGLGLLFAGYALHHDPHVNPAALVGKTAPDLALAPLAGGPARPFRSTGGGVVLINFFQSTCAPCVEESPALMALKAQGVRIFGVAWKDPPEGSKAFLERYGDPFANVFMDPSGRAGVEYGITGVPETFLVAADGKVLAKYIGALTPDQAASIVEKAGR